MTGRRVVVVGAGLSGLLAARRLQAEGNEVVVLDKGRSPGGRMATRRIETADGTAHVDHGAQFFTVRTNRFAAVVDGWRAAGVVHEWCRGFGEADGTHPRFVGTKGMNGVAKHAATGLDVRCNHLAFALRRGHEGAAWSVALDDGTALAADAVVITTPLPQAFALLVTADVELPERLVRTEYDRCLALLAVLDAPGGVPEPGGLQQPGALFSFIGDNRAKGISDVPALTFHAGSAWSEERWDADADEVHAELLAEAEPWLAGASILTSQVKRWRFTMPRDQWPDACWAAKGEPGLVLAGDAFASEGVNRPCIESAALSGLAAASCLLA